MKKAFLFSLFIALCLMAFPVVNMMPRQAAPAKEAAFRVESENPYAGRAAEIFTRKCLDCHTSKTNYPFYYYLPGAHQLISEDIRVGTGEYAMTSSLFGKGRVVPENYLAKLEYVISSGSMPPARYQLLHWGSGLTGEDKRILAGWIEAERRKNAVGLALWNEPIRPIQPARNLNPQKVALGYRLFHDARLSGNNTIACASCHVLNKGGTDRAPVAIGIFGQKGGINAPTVYNAANNFVQFWDGRAADLQAQAAGPVANPIEMGAKWEDVVARLKTVPEYQTAFTALYGDGVSKNSITDAIATFEATLQTPNSRFDQYLAGHETALTDTEKQGYELFKSVGCTTCHMGPNLGGMTYEKMGRKADYFGERRLAGDADKGRFNVTHAKEDLHKFKVPTLRNIAQTAPYFHNASTDDLREAVRVMAKYQLGRNLTEPQIDEITAFLRTLTGEYQGKPVQ